jgi:predicted MFS family arabinose efflux permease
LGLGLTAIAPSLSTLIGARVLTGITAAGIIPVALAYVGDNCSSENRQATLAKFISATISGSIVGQLIGGLASDTVGWRWAFALVCTLFVVTAWSLRGSMLKAYPALNITPHASFKGQVFAGFDKYRQALQVKGMPLFLALTFFQGVINLATMAVLPSFIHQHFEVSLTKASMVVVGYALGSLLYSRTAVHLLKRFEVPQIAFAGGLLQALSFASLVMMPTWSAALIVGLIGGFGSMMLHNSLQTQASIMVPTSTGTSMATFAMTLFLGHAIGVVAITALMTWLESKTVMYLLAFASTLLAGSVYLRFKSVISTNTLGTELKR